MKINEFENDDNYSELIKMYKTALKKKKKNFPFKNKEGKIYAIETDYMTFILKGGANFNGLENLKEDEQKELEKNSKQYKIDESRLTKEELEKKQNEMLASELDNNNDVFSFSSEKK